MTHLRLQFLLAILLIGGIFGIVVLLLLHPVTITADVKTIVESIVGQLLLLLAFVIHSLFGKSDQSVPTVPAKPAQSPESKA